MGSNCFASLIFEETSEEVCLRCNRAEVQTTRQFIRSRPTGSQSSQRRTLVYITNFAGFRRILCNSLLQPKDLHVTVKNPLFTRITIITLFHKLIVFNTMYNNYKMS